jgi:hypothetical protein
MTAFYIVTAVKTSNLTSNGKDWRELKKLTDMENTFSAALENFGDNVHIVQGFGTLAEVSCNRKTPQSRLTHVPECIILKIPFVVGNHCTSLQGQQRLIIIQAYHCYGILTIHNPKSLSQCFPELLEQPDQISCISQILQRK